jgi:hypothetical protein
MKKISILFVIVLLFSLALACGGSAPAPADQTGGSSVSEADAVYLENMVSAIKDTKEKQDAFQAIVKSGADAGIGDQDFQAQAAPAMDEWANAAANLESVCSADVPEKYTALPELCSQLNTQVQEIGQGIQDAFTEANNGNIDAANAIWQELGGRVGQSQDTFIQINAEIAK